MKKTIRLVILSGLVLVMVLSMPVSARTFMQGGVNLLLGFPQGDFKDEVDKTGVGIAGEFLYSPSNSPVGIGVSLGYMIYGHETRREPFSSTIPDVEVEVETSNNILLGHLLLRAQMRHGPIRPYIEGLLGFNYLFTKTTINDIGGGGEDVASSTNLDDFVFSYGAGGGLLIKLYGTPPGAPKELGLYLDLRGRYLIGGKAEYLKEGSIGREDGEVVYDITESKTDLLTARIGLTFEF
nr:hypothetical protein [candidate division Zixibacteria bacterium]